MLRIDSKVLLDACVLANNGVADLLLRLSEGPRLFRPLWTETIIQETSRTLLEKLEWPAELVRSREQALRDHFPEAWVRGYERLVPRLANNAKDRHVLAAAIHGAAGHIATFNLRHFPAEALAGWGVAAVHPCRMLLDLHELDRTAVIRTVREIARDRERPLAQSLAFRPGQ